MRADACVAECPLRCARRTRCAQLRRPRESGFTNARTLARRSCMAPAAALGTSGLSTAHNSLASRQMLRHHARVCLQKRSLCSCARAGCSISWARACSTCTRPHARFRARRALPQTTPSPASASPNGRRACRSAIFQCSMQLSSSAPVDALRVMHMQPTHTAALHQTGIGDTSGGCQSRK